MICHCADCQTLSGSAFPTVAFTREGTFKLLSGKLKIYIKTGESGTKGHSRLLLSGSKAVCGQTAGSRLTAVSRALSPNQMCKRNPKNTSLTPMSRTLTSPAIQKTEAVHCF
jgi:hypothetical protein